MNFELTEDQQMLVDTAAAFARKESPVERRRRLRDDEVGWDKAVWKQMGELGWLSIPFPESVGGYGGRFLDAALVIEQFGRTLVPEPYVPSVVLGGMAILHAGSTEQHRRWLTPLIAGDTSLALAYAERDSRFDVNRVTTTASKTDGGWKIDGEKVFVLNGHAADHIVVSARTSGAVTDPAGVSLFVVDADAMGLTRQSIKTLDGQRAAMLRFSGVEVAADARLGGDHDGARALEAVMDLGAAASCSEGVGIAQAVLDMTVEYLKTREQFGVKIGSFQVLQHAAVDMFIEVELCRSMALLAGIKADDEDLVDRATQISAAKVQLSDGGLAVVRQGIQLHGGVGCTDEHDIGLFFKRMQILSMLFGDSDYHLNRFGAQPSFTTGIEGT